MRFKKKVNKVATIVNFETRFKNRVLSLSLCAFKTQGSSSNVQQSPNNVLLGVLNLPDKLTHPDLNSFNQQSASGAASSDGAKCDGSEASVRGTK